MKDNLRSQEVEAVRCFEADFCINPTMKYDQEEEGAYKLYANVPRNAAAGPQPSVTLDPKTITAKRKGQILRNIGLEEEFKIPLGIQEEPKNHRTSSFQIIVYELGFASHRIIRSCKKGLARAFKLFLKTNFKC